MQQAYLDGLDAEEGIPFRCRREALPEEAGPVTRTAVSAVPVIDLAAMRQELEADPAARRRM